MAEDTLVTFRKESAVEYFKKKLEIAAGVDSLNSDKKLLYLTEAIDKMMIDFNKENMRTGGSVSL